MQGESSITHWIAQLKTGNAAAAEPLWQAYFPRLVALARGRLLNAPRRAADEEDVALSAFHSLCRGAARGRFERLTDRDSLWRLLLVIADRKASHLRRDQGRQKRGGQVWPEPLENADLPDRAPTPEFAARHAEIEPPHVEHRITAQEHIAVLAVALEHRGPGDRLEAGHIRKILHLVGFHRRAGARMHFLKADDIGVDFLEHASDAAGMPLAVSADALMNVVACDRQQRH